MKAILSIAIMLFTVATFAQEQRVEFEKADNNLVKATYYFADNSDVVERVGFFNKDKKLQGTWITYNKAGEKTAVANYENGKKHGEWLYYADGKVKVVTYEFNKITDVKTKDVAVN